MRRVLAVAAAVALFGFAGSAKAAIVNWDIDPSASFIRLNLPDVPTSDSTIGNLTVRLRNFGNSGVWSDAGGRRAFYDGTIQTQYVEGVSLQFLAGQHNAFALEAHNARPNPAAWSTSATDATNTAGSYTNTTTALAAYASRARVSVAALLGATVDAGQIAFRDIELDFQSGSIAMLGGMVFAGGTTNAGIMTAVVDFDGVSLLGAQPIKDELNRAVPNLVALNSGGGVITDLGGLNRRLDYTMNVVIAYDLGGGFTLNGWATGAIVAFATVPEASTLGLLGLATIAFGGVWARRRMRN